MQGVVAQFRLVLSAVDALPGGVQQTTVSVECHSHKASGVGRMESKDVYVGPTRGMTGGSDGRGK